jgi:hypothetical protein
MTTVSILPEPLPASGKRYRAIAGTQQSVGNTPGEALDAITSQMNDQESGTLLVVQQMRPDRFFTEEQQRRLADLMARWRVARDQGTTLPSDEQGELEQLVAAELEGATRRAAAMLDQLKK